MDKKQVPPKLVLRSYKICKCFCTGEKILTLCFKIPYNKKGCYDGNNLSTHYNKQRVNRGNSTALESMGIKQMR